MINKKFNSLLEMAGTNSGNVARAVASGDGATLQSIYYSLNKRIVSQALTEYFRGNPELNIFNREDWINGVKEWFSIGFPEIKDFTTDDITIDDFNPQDFTIKNYIFKTDSMKIMSYRLRFRDLIDFFTSPSRVVSFYETMAKKALQKVQLFLFQSKFANLLGTSDKKIDIVYDSTINTNGLDTQQILAEMRKKIVSLETPSHTHLVKPTNWDNETYKKFVYSAKAENLSIIWNTKFYSGDLMNLTATLFNKNDILVKVKSSAIDFSKIPNTTQAETDKIVAFIVDDSALKIGFQAVISQQIKTPKFGLNVEIGNFYGFARLRDYFIGKVVDSGPSRRFKSVEQNIANSLTQKKTTKKTNKK